MARHRRKRAGRWALGTALAATVACAGLGVGAAVAAFGLLDGTPAHAGATYIPPSITTVAPRLASDPKARPLARSAPVKIGIPRIGVNAPVMKLGRDADGTVQVPPLAAHNLAGWYRYGPSPGQRGPAVILGHVDSTTGISVFYYLKNLHAGDALDVTLADGTVARFAVDGLQKVAKDAFPTATIYGPVPAPEVRLITCGGDFDRSSGHYRDNVVVFARLP